MPQNTVYGSAWPKGSIIQMFDEQLRIRENYGTGGTVEYLDGSFCSHSYKWVYGDEKAKLISTP